MSIDTAQQVAPVLPAATLDGDGNPVQPWALTSVGRTDWGEQRVWIDGTDRTEYLKAGYRTTWADRWTFVKPHWFGEATIRVAKVRSYAAPPSWCAVGKDVHIRHRLPDGVTYNTDVRSEWRGKVARVVDGDAKTTTLEVTGWYQVADWFVRAPAYSEDPVESGVQWQGNLTPSTRNYPWSPNEPDIPTTGVDTTQHGNWETALDYLTSLNAPLPGWTWRPADATYKPSWVDTTVTPGDTYTLRHGTPGVEVSLVQDLRTAVNVIYAEGFSDGEPWRIVVVDELGTGLTHLPLSADPLVHTLFYDPVTGGFTEDTSLFDASVPRIETFWKLPAGMTYTQAKSIADEFRSRVAGPGWTGNITLTVSPSEGHLLDIRPDDVVTLQGYRGGDVDLHVGEVAYSWNKGSPTCELAVDTNGRSLAAIDAILHGDIEQATNPFFGIQIGRQSGLKNDEKARWSNETGSGYGPMDPTNGYRNKDATATFPVTCGQWNEYIAPFSEEDSIMYSLVVCSIDGLVDAGGVGGTGRAFTALLTDRTLPLPPDVDSPLPVDPSAADVWDDQTISDCGMQQGWGFVHDGKSDMAGYGHVARYHEYNADPITGQLIDDEVWSYTHGDLSVQPGANRLAFYIFPYGTGAAECWFQFVRKGAP